MVGLLFLAFLVVPFLELFVILRVGQAIGALNTIGLLILVSATGAWLVKREGLAVLRRAQDRIRAGGVPAKELIDGVLILFAGALLLTPGFLTDVVGVLLLLPPVRAGLRASTTDQLRRRVTRRRVGTGRFR
ncbi:MAG: FxsA family protein [Actinomycetota bacterium]|nr:FxsA family protein [Actinomycetota bacterium]